MTEEKKHEGWLRLMIREEVEKGMAEIREVVREEVTEVIEGIIDVLKEEAKRSEYERLRVKWEKLMGENRKG